MTCSSCSAVIEKTLTKVTGVQSASVNLASETATVAFDPAVVGLDALIGAVKGAGYDAVLRVETGTSANEPVEDVQRAAQAAHTRHETRLFVFSLVFAAARVPHLDGAAVHDGGAGRRRHVARRPRSAAPGTR